MTVHPARRATGVAKIVDPACKSGRVQVAILGPLEVRGDDGKPVDIAGARLRSLLTRLALDAGRPVGVPILVDAVWGAHPPTDEANALQTLVSRLRRALGDATLIGQSAAGYRLGIAAADVDAHRFERLAADGTDALRRGDTDRAAVLFDDALALWRGPALVDAGEAVEAEAVRLHDLRLAVQLDRVDALLALGRTGGLVAEVEARLAERPLDERLSGQLMRALAATGRQAEALAAYERLRARLADELGVDPGADVQAVHLAILRGELAAAPTAPAGAVPATSAGAAPRERRTNLKAQLTSFVGRDDEVARIGKSLEQNRLVTLVGPGGAGKTRLAGEAASTLVGCAADGIWMVELAPVTDPADLPQTVLGSLGVREAHLLDRRSQLSVRDATSRLLETLADKETILILDNCEHLVEASARLADQLLARCPQLRVLTTSREPLGIFGEVLLVVPPLVQPDPSARAEEALGYPAVRLFADRAAAVVPDFVIDDTTIGTVIEIVRRLDGLPLAIELAAARLRGMPLGEIAARLSDRFRLLTGGSRTAMPRHRTLRAVVEWSWELLAPAERLLAERLAVFASGATAASAVAVCTDEQVAASEVSDLLAALVDKSLLQPVAGGERVRMLETIREYGIERLDERGELAELRGRHADYFAELLHEAQPHLVSAEQLPWFALLRAERENILAAIRYRADSGDVDGALDIAVILGGFAMLLGNHSEVPLVVAPVLAIPGGEDVHLRWLGEAMCMMNSVMGTVQGGAQDPEVAMLRLHEICEHLDVIEIDSSPLVGLLKVAVAYFSGEVELADRCVAEALAGPHPWTAASVLMFRGNLAENTGDLAAMRADTYAALERFRGMGERWGTASTLRVLALLHTYDGELDAAEAAYHEALELMAQMGSRDDEGFLRVRLADLRLRRGDRDGAGEQMALARAASEQSGSALESVFALCMTALIERECGNEQEARRLYEEVCRRVDQIPVGHPVHRHLLAITQTMIGDAAMRDGDLAAARPLLAEAFATAVGTTDLPIVASVGVCVAELTAREGDFPGAARRLAAAAVLRGAEDSTALDVARLRRRLIEELGEQGFAEAYDAGRSLDRDAALALLDPDPAR
jgi:predicted ATPase/DNA-binding SARP family transcriptional activator